VQCTGQPEQRDFSLDMSNAEFDLNSSASCSSAAADGSSSSASATDHALSRKDTDGTEIQLKALDQTDASASQAWAEGNFKINGEADSYWQLTNPGNRALLVEGRWSITAQTNTVGFGDSTASASLQITDADGNSLTGISPMAVSSPPNANISRLFRVCLPPQGTILIELTTDSYAKALSADGKLVSRSRAFGSAFIALKDSEISCSDSGVTYVDITDAPPDI